VASTDEKRWLKRLGENTRRMRVEKGLTQQRLAELANLDLRTIQRIEAGDFNVLLTTFNRVRRALASSWEPLVPKE